MWVMFSISGKFLMDSRRTAGGWCSLKPYFRLIILWSSFHGYLFFFLIRNFSLVSLPLKDLALICVCSLQFPRQIREGLHLILGTETMRSKQLCRPLGSSASPRARACSVSGKCCPWCLEEQLDWALWLLSKRCRLLGSWTTLGKKAHVSQEDGPGRKEVCGKRGWRWWCGLCKESSASWHSGSGEVTT